MSWNKNTIAVSVVTTKPFRDMLTPVPYALVLGNGANDRAEPRVLCYADINGRTYYDVRTQTPDCDFDDVIECRPLSDKRKAAVPSVAYDYMFDEVSERTKVVSRGKLQPLTELYVLKDRSIRKPSTHLIQGTALAQQELSTMQRHGNIGDWVLVPLTAAELAARVEGATFLGI